MKLWHAAQAQWFGLWGHLCSCTCEEMGAQPRAVSCEPTRASRDGWQRWVPVPAAISTGESSSVQALGLAGFPLLLPLLLLWARMQQLIPLPPCTPQDTLHMSLSVCQSSG